MEGYEEPKNHQFSFSRLELDTPNINMPDIDSVCATPDTFKAQAMRAIH